MEVCQRRPESRGPPRPGDAGKCLLWDSVEKRHADEVAAAAKRAIEEYKRDHPDIEEKDLQVELPKAPPAGPSNTHGLPVMPPPLPRVWMHHGLPPLPANLALHPPHRVQHIGNINPQAEMNGLIHRALLPPGEVHVHHHHHPQNPVFNLHLNLDRVRALENRLANAPALPPIPLPDIQPAQFLPPNLPRAGRRTAAQS
ncbi:hypothetical protein NLI96_g11032 [Meripilus lineatus]|uniref:Uncharacterized protein n=1 Tax=Meripilus lineatus TaxID=2056292 RepID=A0AAD5YBE0_9APHY|nr:hypothetical protein NLI96_g11032 [Physisporinus lineatus]